MRKILFLLTLLIVNTTMATNYYFSSTDGDDSRSVSQAQNLNTPWQTISKLNSVLGTLQSGDIVYFKRGDTFYGSVTANRSGITYDAYGTHTDKPVITGFVDLSLSSIGGGRWESQNITSPQVIVQNTVLRLPARFPNSGYNRTGNSGANQFTSQQAIANWVGGEVVVRKNPYIIDRGVITNQSGNTITYNNISPDGHINGYGYFIQNHINAIDTDNEWAYSGGKVVLQASVTPTGWRAAQLNTGFVVTQSSTIKNIIIEGFNQFGINATTAVTVENCSIRHIGSFGLRGNNGTMTALNNSLSNCGNVALYLQSCNNSIIRGNSVINSGIEGMGESLNITALEYCGITIGDSHGTTVELNVFTEIGYNAVNFLFTNNLTVQKNFIEKFCKYKNDGGGIYTYRGSQSPTNFTNTRLLDNIVVNGYAPTESTNDNSYTPTYGIYIDDNANAIEIRRNTAAGNPNAGLFLHNTRDNIVTDNVFYDNGKGTGDPAAWTQVELLNNSGEWLIRNNVFTGNQLIAVNSNQLCLKWDSQTDDINLAGNFDQNVYARPINDNQVFRIYTGGASANFYTLAGWKTYSGKDFSSTKSPKTVSVTSDLRLEYNATNSTVNRSLGNGYIDFKNNAYLGTATILAYRSVPLILQPQVLSLPIDTIFPDRNLRGKNVLVFPTITNSTVNVVVSRPNLYENILVYNISGSLLQTITTIQRNNTVDLSLYPSGIFIIRISDKTFKIIKQ